MPRCLVRLTVALGALLVLSTLAPTASAQLELPKKRPTSQGTAGERQPTKPKVPGRGLVPHLVCTICGEHNYVSRMDRPTPDGNYTAHCTPCGRDQPHQRAKEAAQDERLDIPRDKRPAVLPGIESDPRPVNAQGGSKYGQGAAAFILDRVAAAKDVHDSVVHKGVESLIGLGEEGLVAARIAIHDETEPVVVAAGRVLIHSDVAEDKERVIVRLRGQMPGKTGPMLLEELVRRDPVHGSPALLAELLEHRQQPVRQVAQRYLSKSMSPETLPLLLVPLESKRTDTRLMALSLAVMVDDPAVTDLLLTHLDDRSARVASEVVTALANRADSRIELELLARAFKSRWILRENAYALLALVEREDNLLVSILDERHVEPLLRGLESSDPLTVGSCAAALAGIGYRSSRPEETAWLDRDVTGFMIAAISGKDFHSDFSSLQPRVLRRLRLLTGEDFGTDGPAWVSWWIEHRSSFYAHRAYLGVPEGGEGQLELHYRATGIDSAAVSLLGAQVTEREARKRAGAAEVYYLTERECRDLLALMKREGVLGPERAPGQRGSSGTGMRTLEVIIAGHGKEFLYGPGQAEPWFDRLGAAVRDLGERNRWQRFPDSVRYSTPREFWETEAGWWAGDHTDLERALRMKELVFASIRSSAPSMRSAALKELARVSEVPGAALREDFQVYLDLLRDEGFFTGRTQQLVDLALATARVERSDGLADPELCADLLGLLLARFQLEALPAMGEVARSCGVEFLRGLALDQRPVLRAVAAAELAKDVQEADAEILLGMLDDPEPMVESAAVLALGEGRVEAARTELLLRARLAPTVVRSAALRSIGLLGGDYVLEALVLGVSDPDPEIKLGAAQGLAELADPQSAPLLISLLGRGRDSQVYETAKLGLLKLGDAAKGDLLRVVNSPAHQARREAALLLGLMCVPEVIPALIDMIDTTPSDEGVGFELATLTCFDQRAAEDPAARWAEWYDEVNHDSSLPWLLAAMERRGVSAPPAAEFAGKGTREVAMFLLEVLDREEDFLAERARREFNRMLGHDLGAIPRSEEEREAWVSTLSERLLALYEGEAVER
jgi:HEAT repeat protein